MSEGEDGDSAIIGVGVIGFGFMGATHARAYQRAARLGYPCRLVAIADPDPSKTGASGNIDSGEEPIDLEGVSRPTSAEDLLADDRINLVSICTPTPTHIELARSALAAGKHVLVEKPVATSAKPVEDLASFASERNTLCMPAMCIRFWPAWVEMARAVRSGEHGALRSVALCRMGARPGWSPAYYADDAQTGGLMADLHLHDTDYLVSLLGRPDAVRCDGDDRHCTSVYRYARGPAHVTAECAWDPPQGFGFRMRATMIFDRASLDFDIARADQLILADATGSRPIPLGSDTGYDMQIRALLDAITRGDPTPPITLADAAEVMHVLDAERQSLKTGASVNLPPPSPRNAGRGPG